MNERLQLIFDSPIEAGVFLAMLMPWVAAAWRVDFRLRLVHHVPNPKNAIAGLSGTGVPPVILGAQASARAQIPKPMGGTPMPLDPIAEFGLKTAAALLWFCMAAGVALTGSRGPVLGVVAGAAVFLLGAGVLRWERWRGLALCMGAGLCLMAGVLWLSPSGARFAPGFVAGDASVGNRWEIWKGASQMIFIRPWSGVGLGEGGQVFSEWYQPGRLDYAYTSLLNSWLEIGVELGIPVLLGCVFVGALAQGLVLARGAGEGGLGGLSAFGLKTRPPDGLESPPSVKPENGGCRVEWHGRPAYKR